MMSPVRVCVAALLLTAPGAGAQRVVDLPGQDRALELALQPVYVVGAVEGEDWEVFGSVDAVAFDGEGNLYVLDGQNARVVVFDREGGHLRTVGRRGEGPGEFQMPQGMTVTAAEELVVYDMARSAYSVLAMDGSFVGSVPTDLMSLGARPQADLRPYPRGGFLSAYRGFDLDTGNPDTDVRNGDALPILRYDLAAGEGAELFRGRFTGPPATMVARPGERRMNMGAPPAFSPRFRWGVLPDGGAAWMEGAGYAVSVVGPDGTVVRTLRRPFEPRRVTARDREDEKARRLEILDSTGEGAPVSVTNVNGVMTTRRDVEAGKRMVEQLEFAEFLPVLADLAVDGEGRIWVQRTGARVRDVGPTDLLGAEGEYLGTVTGLDHLPDAFGTGGRAAWIQVGEYGVARVRVARLGVM
jgi:hypothetical protein